MTMSFHSNVFGPLFVVIFGFSKMTAKVLLTTSLILHLCSFTSYTYAFMRLNIRAAASTHSVVPIPHSYIKFESCPSSGPLNASCNAKYAAVKVRFGPAVKDLVGRYIAVTPRDACDSISPINVREMSSSFIAIVSKGNCSFDVKVFNAERAGYHAVIIYARKNDKDLLDTSSTTNPSIRVSIPSFYVSYSTGTKLAYSSRMTNGTRPSLLLIATRKKAYLPSPPNLSSKLGAMNANVGEEEDGDNFGEHYFRICIYIWACVVISSLIGLSVKWGCCGRSLTRWEVTKIPLKRFRRNSGCEYQDKCPICHEEFHEGRLIRQLPCNHCYHSYCVDRWLVKMSNRCPLCKQRVSVSLFCSWNKQRDSEVLQQSDADLDAEASIGELPPLPPVQMLTPNSLYGDVIMSGPSKFILMRPGKATRIIEVPKKETDSQNKPCTNSQGDDAKDKKSCTKVPLNKCDKNAVTTLSTSCSDSSKQIKEKENIQEDVICMETFNHHSSLKTSRSSSITSEHPLLQDEDRVSVAACMQSSGECAEGECVFKSRDGNKCVLVLDDVNQKKKGTGTVHHHHNSGERSRRKNSGKSKQNIGDNCMEVVVASENHNMALEVNVNFSQFPHVDIEQCSLRHQLSSGDDSCDIDGDSCIRTRCALDSMGYVNSDCGGDIGGAAVCGGRDGVSGRSLGGFEVQSGDSGGDGKDAYSFNRSDMDANLAGSRRELGRDSYSPSLLPVSWDESLRQ